LISLFVFFSEFAMFALLAAVFVTLLPLLAPLLGEQLSFVASATLPTFLVVGYF